MFTFPISRRQVDHPSARRPRARRPIAEDLEGRRLPSGIVGSHIGMNVAPAIVGPHRRECRPGDRRQPQVAYGSGKLIVA